MKFLEVFVHKTNGSGFTAGVFRSSAEGRREADKLAQTWLMAPKVESVVTVPVDRIAQSVRGVIL